MKIIKAEIVGFGKYQHVTFSLNEPLLLIYGGNEAGKSTLFQFIVTILFGFPKKSKYQKDYTPKGGARFGGHLYLETPMGPVKVSRFKDENKAQITLLKSGEVGDDRLLTTLLKPLTKEAFLAIFSFQEEQLQGKKGYTQEELQKSLLSLGLLGSNDLFQWERQFLEKEQQIFKRNGQKPVLNQLLQKEKTLQQHITQQSEKEATFKNWLQQEITAKKTSENVQQQLLENQNLQQTLLKQQVLLPLKKEWETVKQATTPLLSVFEEERLTELYEEFETLQGKRLQLESQIQRQSGLKEIAVTDYLWYQKQTKLFTTFHEKLIQQQQQEKDYLLQKGQGLSLQAEKQHLEELYHFQSDNPPRLMTESEKKAFEDHRQQENASKIAIFLKPETYFILAALFLIGIFFLPTFFKGVLVLFAGISGYLGIKKMKSMPKGTAFNETKLRKILNIGTLPLETLLLKENPVKRYLELSKAVILWQEKSQAFQLKQQNFATFIKENFPFVKTATLEAEIKEVLFFEEEMAKVAFAKKQNQIETLEKALFDLQKQQETLKQQLFPYLEKLQLTEFYQLPETLRKEKENRYKYQRKEELYPKLKDHLNHQEFVFFSETELKQQELELTNQLQETTLQIQKSKAQQELLQENGTLTELQQQLSTLQAKQMSLTKELLTYRFARQFLVDLSKELSEQRLPYLLKTVSRLFKTLTLGNYQRIFFVKEEIQVQDKEGILFELKDLSSGSQDQLIFAFRLGFLSLQGKNPLAPVIIDDGWLKYDSLRKLAFLQLLKENPQLQIILLSSDKEVRDFFQQEQLPMTSLT